MEESNLKNIDMADFQHLPQCICHHTILAKAKYYLVFKINIKLSHFTQIIFTLFTAKLILSCAGFHMQYVSQTLSMHFDNDKRQSLNQNTNTEEKPYHCEVGGKCFTKTLHVKSGTGKNEFCCELC